MTSPTTHRLVFLLAATAALLPMAAAAEPVRVKVMSFNVWYGGEQVNFQAVIDAIKSADPDIVGIQEPDGNLRRIAAATGYPYVDSRRHLIAKVPLFDSGVGERTETTNPPYSLAGVGDHAVHAWAIVAPGAAIAVSNVHLTSDPYGPEMVRDGASLADILANEQATRVPEAQALIDGLAPVAARGVPTILTGDFNTPSWRDWTAASATARPQTVKQTVDWPVSRLVEAAGFVDSFRAVHPDPVAVPGITWTAGYPNPYVRATETLDRIDFIYAANAKPVDSVIVGEAGNPAVTIAVRPWPSDHRAMLTTFEVEPVKAPPLIAVEPTLVAEGQTFLIRANAPDHAPWTTVVVPRGGNPATDAITGLADMNPDHRLAIKLSTIGLSPAPYDAVLLSGDGTELARTRFSVTTADARATVAVASGAIVAGADIPVRWDGAPGDRFDWIGVYKRHETSVYAYLGYVYTGARHDGTLTIPASVLYEPLAPGDYELRLMHDDHYAVIAVAPFTVVAGQ